MDSLNGQKAGLRNYELRYATMKKGETADGLLSPGFPVWDIGRGGAAALQRRRPGPNSVYTDCPFVETEGVR